MIDVLKAILKINPNAQVSVNGDDINQITWYEGTTPIPVADIQAKMVELQAEYEANQYQRDRAEEYPEIKEQLDKLFHDINNGTLDNTGEFFTAINTVKTNNPKPSEDD